MAGIDLALDDCRREVEMKKVTVRQIAEKCGFSVLAGAGALDREAGRVFCCDLLSFVMGRAPADCAWITVMGNVNAIAVAVLADTACIVLAENARAGRGSVYPGRRAGCAGAALALPDF